MMKQNANGGYVKEMRNADSFLRDWWNVTIRLGPIGKACGGLRRGVNRRAQAGPGSTLNQRRLCLVERAVEGGGD